MSLWIRAVSFEDLLKNDYLELDQRSAICIG